METNIQSIVDLLLDSADRALFKKLFFEGDTNGFSSTLAAETELCKMIAEFTEDPSEIDAVFHESALYRPKVWNFNLYGDNVITSAISLLTADRPVPPFVIRSIINNGRDVVEHISPQLLAAWIRKNVTYHFVKDSVTMTLSIYLYENGVYREIDSLHFMGLIKKAIEDYNPLLAESRTITEVYSLLSKDLDYLRDGDFNEDENIINFQNGILHLDTMELKPHSPKYLTTIQIPSDWSANAKDTPVFDAYLKTLTNCDADVQKFLLQYIGVILSNIQGWRMKIALILVGKGNSGKSQLRRLAELLVGKGNYATIDLPDLETKYGPGDLLNMRLAGCADMKFVSLKSLKFFKLITGGDTIRAERKYRNAISMVYRGLLWFCTNELPRFGGDKGKWVYDRFCIVHCDNVIPEKDRDNHILDKMYAEREGIITKAVLSLRELIDNNYRFVEPKAIVDARRAYSKDNNVVGRFFEDCIVPSTNTPNYKCSSVTRVHEAFGKWCINNNNNHRLGFQEFKRELADYLDVDVKNLLQHTSNGDIIRGYTLSDTANTYF